MALAGGKGLRRFERKARGDRSTLKTLCHKGWLVIASSGARVMKEG